MPQKEKVIIEGVVEEIEVPKFATLSFFNGGHKVQISWKDVSDETIDALIEELRIELRKSAGRPVSPIV